MDGVSPEIEWWKYTIQWSMFFHSYNSFGEKQTTPHQTINITSLCYNIITGSDEDFAHFVLLTLFKWHCVLNLQLFVLFFFFLLTLVVAL